MIIWTCYFRSYFFVRISHRQNFFEFRLLFLRFVRNRQTFTKTWKLCLNLKKNDLNANIARHFTKRIKKLKHHEIICESNIKSIWLIAMSRVLQFTMTKFKSFLFEFLKKKRLKKKRYAIKYKINNFDKTQFMYLYFRWIISINVFLNYICFICSFNRTSWYINKSKILISNFFYITSINSSTKCFFCQYYQNSNLFVLSKKKKRVRQLFNSTTLIYILFAMFERQTTNSRFLMLWFISLTKKIFHTLLLIFKKIIDVHNEKNIISIIWTMFEKYNIRNNLNYFVMNNIENNDTMLIVISNILRTIYNIYYDSI